MRLFSQAVASTAYKVTQTLTGVECDICKKVIPVSKFSDDKSRYYEVTTGHHDWGNDSCESIETLDICPECLLKHLAEYFKDPSGTAYCNITAEYAYPKKDSKIMDKPPKEDEIIKKDHDVYW